MPKNERLPFDRFFSALAAGIGFGLYGLLVCTAGASADHPAPPPAAADSHKKIVHAVLPPLASPETQTLHEPLRAAVAPASHSDSHEPAGHEKEEHPTTGRVDHDEIKSRKTAGAMTLPFELSLAADPAAGETEIYILKLKRQGGAAWPVGEVLVWWTTPNGRKTSIAMKQLDDNVWASRVALEKSHGHNRLTAVILSDSERDSKAQTVELVYEAVLPGGALEFVRQGEFGKKESAAAVEGKKTAVPSGSNAAKAKKDKSTWSVQVVVILVGVANLLLLLPCLLLARLFRRVFAATDPDGETARSLFTAIFSNAGLIERDESLTHALDEDATEKIPCKEPLNKEMFEATILEPAAAQEPPPARKKENSDKDSNRDGTIGGIGGNDLKLDLSDLSF